MPTLSSAVVSGFYLKRCRFLHFLLFRHNGNSFSAIVELIVITDVPLCLFPVDVLRKLPVEPAVYLLSDFVVLSLRLVCCNAPLEPELF